ncbi:hypothetical protein G9A89_014296 [Geosiphon pyriformis]|nr:hypothetical protein G9A89_014296 [Geosiphon pyriformis]
MSSDNPHDYTKSEKPDISQLEVGHPRPTASIRHVKPKIGNPTPLGLSAFALSVMITAFYNCQAFGISLPNVAVGVALFTGGVVQFAAGMWEFRVGNTFGGTGFSAFGGFWASYAALYISGFGIESAYSAEKVMYDNALGVYCLAWTIFTFIFTLACIRTNMGVLSAFVFLTGVFISLTLFHFTRVIAFQTIAGVLGIITSLIVWYCFAAVLLTPDLSPISLPLWDLSQPSS